MVVLRVSKNKREKALLEKDLCIMDYHGLLERSWSLCNKEVVRELTMAKSSEWDQTLQRALDWWTSNIWQGMYTFPKGGEGVASWMDKFSILVNPYDGFALTDCKDILL